MNIHVSIFMMVYESSSYLSLPIRKENSMSKGRKILIIILSILVVMIIIVVVGMVSLQKSTARNLETYATFDYTSLDLSKVADGTYIGSEDADMVKVKVEVAVKDHAITDITILQHDNGKGKPAEVIVDDIIQTNSLAVDTISGATYSSYAIKTAIYNALLQQ